MALVPLAALRRKALVRGVLGGDRGWLAVGAVLWGGGLLKRAVTKQTELLTIEKLAPGQGLRIDTFKPDTRRAARRAR